ncbi:MAG: hypothetical protein F6K50_52315, partial [Moorea sp. SIO3I7]|nr:hypothetical protein [Moorena sp. SIO3I7]
MLINKKKIDLFFFYISYYRFPTPYSRFPTPYSPLPIPYFLKLNTKIPEV